ncbi:fumarylacetoacetate hydrolase family protein [Rhodococcus corynebacterioides]|nr:fumarylacetoacetate hydrolase family protein [Rhodococcus corynebacterioides]
MRFASVETAEGRTTVIADVGDGRPTADIGNQLSLDSITVQDVIDLDATAYEDLVRRVRSTRSGDGVDLLGVTFLPPVLRPSKIVGVALNNDVFNYLAVRKMQAPMYFLAPSTSLLGHGGSIELDSAWGLVHPEPELGAVIGRPLRRVTPSEALAGVFGYTIVNDITSPGLKSEDSIELVMPQGFPVDEPWRRTHGDDDRSLYLTYHARSKGTDTFTPAGPWVATRAAVPDPNSLTVRSYLDDELVLEDSTANLTFPVQDVLAHLSHSMTLLPGDIVHFGTAARPSKPDVFPTIRSIDLTRHGDRVSVEIDGIGRLDNHIVRLA